MFFPTNDQVREIQSIEVARATIFIHVCSLKPRIEPELSLFVKSGD